MAPMKMKAASKAAMSKTAIFDSLAKASELKKADVKKVLDGLAVVATKEVKSTGKFTVPGLVMIKLRKKPATKAGKRTAFGKVVMVKAKPACNVVKAFCVSALKKSI